MQCLRIWFTIWLFAISVNDSVASPVDILNVDNKAVGDLDAAESKKDDAVVSERDNEVGYLRRADEKGADAYQHFESFHDKDGDAYGYEKHEAYGKSDKGESLNDGKDKSEGSHYNYVQELGDKPKYQKYHGSNDRIMKPNYSSNYKQEARKEDDSAEEEEDEEQDSDSKEADEEKTTNFRYKIVSDDYDENDGHADINSKTNGDSDGDGYHFGHGDRKKTNVDYNVKKSDYTAGDDDDDKDDDNDDEDDDEDEGSEEEDDENVIVKHQKINDDQGKAKDTKSYSTYTTYSSEEGDEAKDDANEKNTETDKIPVNIVRYENTSPIKANQHSTKQNIVVKHDSEEDNESEDDDGGDDNDDDDDDDKHVNEDVGLHQPAAKPRPTKPVELVKEHRTQYKIENQHPESIPTKPQAFIQPTKPIVVIQEHHAGYKVEESDGGKGSDESGDSIILNCQAEGTPTPEILWYKDANPVDPSSTVGIFNDGTELRISTIRHEDIGDYTCIARNGEGQVSHTARVIIAGGAVIMVPPTNQTKLEGEKAIFTCEAKAMPGNVTVRWFREGSPVREVASLETRVAIRKDGSLIINPVSADDSGQYLCEVSNGIGDPQSASVYLNVEYPAKVTFTPTVQYLPFRLAGVVQCYIKSNPPLQYVTWTKDKRLLEPYQTKDIVIMNNGSLLFTRVNQNHQGRYTCTPYNAQGTKGSSGAMEVLVRKPSS